MEIDHYDLNTKEYINKHELVPQWPFRLIICGNSGCGKTNVLLNLVLKFLHFDELYVFARDIDEPAYQFLVEIFDKIDDISHKFSSDPEDIINVDDLDPEKQNLIVFDDYVTAKDQKPIIDLFIRGRKKNASIIYLTQSYYKVPKTIRLQCNYIVLFPSCAEKDMNLILKEFSLDHKLTKNLYQQVTNKPYNFFTLDLKNPETKYGDRFNVIK